MLRLPKAVGECALEGGRASAHGTAAPTRRRFLADSLFLALGSLAATWSTSTARAASPDFAPLDPKDEAEQAIPFDKMKPATRAKLLAVVDRPTLFRKLTPQTILCDHDLHVYLTRYPEIVVNIWRLMGITNMQADRVADYSLAGSDGAGTTSRIDLVYGTPELHVFYCEGEYEGPLFKHKTTGRSVLLLRSQFAHDRIARPYVMSQLDVFLQVDNMGAGLVTKTLHSTVGKTIDTNFSETLKFVARISDSAEKNGAGMQNMAAKLTDCKEPIRQGFANVCSNVTLRAAERLASEMEQAAAPASASKAQPASASRANTRR